MQAADDTIALSERLVPPSERGQRLFWYALGFAFLFHAALFIELARTVPKRAVGDRSGETDAIAVELVTAADLRSLESVASPPPGAPAPPPAVAQPEPTPPQPEPPQPEPPAEPPPKAAEPAPPPPAPKPPEPAVEPKSALPDFESVLPDLATLPQPTEPPKEPEPQKPEEAKPQEKVPEPAQPADTRPVAPAAKKKPQQQARLQPTPSPKDLMSAPPGRSAAATRPPGITRSGENDEFGRAVIRALRQTMPPPNGALGRVTVRLLLTENGDLAQVQVLEPSGVPGMDQNVVFATRQTYFPLPPYKATVADRTFIITYVYR
jgi:protein TonB